MNLSSMLRWALSETVELTVLSNANSVLVTRLDGPGAMVVEATEDGWLFVNGVNIIRDASEDEITRICALTDAVLVGMPKNGQCVMVNAAEQSASRG